MQPTPLISVVDDVWRWSHWNEPRKLWFNGHLLRVGTIVIAIDPVDVSDEVAGAITAIGTPAIIVVTNRDHARATAACAARWGARVHVPAADAAAIGLAADRLLASGDAIGDELVALAVADAKTPGETALWWPRRRLMILGDAAIGRPSGALTMVPDDKLADPAKARAGVAALAERDVEIVLVGDGDDLLAGGAAAIRALAPGPARAPVGGAPGC
jgi:glyoxylase-like metal-dependent hydrolase (beta-lactamase superfamily II)